MIKRIIIFLLFSVSVAHSEQYTPAGYIGAVFAVSPDVKTQELSYKIAKNNFEAAFIDANLPSLSLAAETPLFGYNGADYRGLRLDRSEITSSANISWNLYNSGKDSLSIKSYRLSRDIAAMNLRAQKQTTALGALNAYYDLLLKAKLLKVALNDLNNQESLYIISQSLYKSGLQGLTDKLQSETNMRSSQLRYASAQAAYAQAQAAFNIPINREPDAPAELDETIVSSTEPATTVQTDINMALAKRPEVLSARMGLEQAEVTRRLSVREQLPSLNADFSWNKYGLSMFGLPSSSADPNPDYAVTAKLYIPIGFFWQSEKRTVETASLTEDSARQSFETLQRGIKAGVFTARTQLDLQIRSLGLSDFMQDVARQKQDLVQEQYRQGIADSVKLSQAQSDYLTAQNSYVTALVQAALADAAYRRALGYSLWEE